MIWWYHLRRATSNCHRVLSMARRRAEDAGAREVEVNDVLFVLLQNEESVGAALLHLAGVPTKTIIPAPPAAAQRRPGRRHRGRARFSSAVRALIQTARAAARDLGHSYIGTEHIVIAALNDDASVLTTALRKQGFEPADILKELLEALLTTGQGKLELPAEFLPVPRVRREDLPADVRTDPLTKLMLATAGGLTDEEYACSGFVRAAWERGPATREQLAEYLVDEYASTIRIAQEADQDEE